MENKTSFRVVSPKELWDILVLRLWIMVLALVVVVVGMFSVVTFAIPPKYESVATLYILKQNENQAGQNNYSDNFSLALKVVNDCNHLLKSHLVLDQVIEDLALDMSYDELRSSVSVVNPSETRILEVKVRSSSPELSKRIVDQICDTGIMQINKAMGFRQVNLYEYGILDTAPCNRLGILVYMLAGVGSAVLVYGAFLLAYIFDDRIRENEELEKELGLSVLGEIPDSDTTRRRKYKYYRYYSKNSKYSKYKYHSSESSEKEGK